MKRRFILGLLACMLVVSVVSAYEVNYTTSTANSGLALVKLKYEPYPVNPGEYFDLWIKAEKGSGTVYGATFELLPEFPFSLDSNDSVRKFGQLTSEPVVLHYKVRIDKDAVEGINKIKLRYNTDGKDNYWIIEEFDISVANAQTDFDLIIQESSGTEASLAIANTGKNTANSLIVRIPQQEGFRVIGTNGQMVGNLESGDYSIVSFTLQPIGRGSSEKTLNVQMDYTDSIGERRSIVKEIPFDAQLNSLNSSQANGFQRGNFASRSQTSKGKIFTSIWFWVIAIVLFGIIIFFYKKHIKKKRANSEKKEKPDWVLSEKASKSK